jgi:hypothetical protein
MKVFTPAFLAGLTKPLEVTPGRLEFCQHWANGEGTNAQFNPFATTLQTANELPGLKPNGDPAAWFNSFTLANGAVLHVRNYKDLAAGVEATVKTIEQSNFKLILQSLQQERVLPGLADVIRSTWGTVGFANEFDHGFVPAGWTSGVDAGGGGSTTTGGAKGGVTTALDAAAVRQIAASVFEQSFGELWVLLLEMAAGTVPSTFGTKERARVDAAIAAIRSGIANNVVAPHVHDFGAGTTGGVHGKE